MFIYLSFLGGVPQIVEFAPLQSFEYDGIQDISTALPRTHLVATLFDMVTKGSSRFVHLGSAAGSGKTSLLQLLQQYSLERGVTCIYVSMLLEDFRTVMIRKTGINASTWMLENDESGRCVCADLSKRFVVMLDDAQHQYNNISMWSSLIKPDMNSTLPDNIRFVISADHSPVDFRTLPKLVFGDFVLSPEEVNEFIRLSSVRMSAERAGTLLVEPGIRNMVAANCNGNIGALALSVREIVKRFHHNPDVTIEDIVSFYLSKLMFSYFLRCYSSGVVSLPMRMQACLVRCLTEGPLSVPQDEDPEVYRKLIRCGVLLETKDGEANFTSPAAAGYINNLLFPRRSENEVDCIRERGVFGLMKSVLAHMSATTLKRSVVDSSTDMPCETTFQHLMLAALEAETPSSCFICPNLSKYFPLSTSHVMGATQLPEVKGRWDYYLNGNLRWVIEALMCGRGWGEHMSRLEGQDRYVGLAYADYLMVDFQANATGNPTNVQRHVRRMSVFFKQGDFTFCNVLCGFEPTEMITLTN